MYDIKLGTLLPLNPDFERSWERSTSFENILGKGENAGNQHFLLSQNVFYLSQNECQILSHIYFVLCKGFEFGPV